MAQHSVKAFTKDKLHKMEASGHVPMNRDRDADSEADNYGFRAAGSSNSAQFRHGGATGEGKYPHLGRARRATGGRLGATRDMYKASTDATHLPDNVKLPIPRKARGGRAEHYDEAEDRALVKKMVKPSARTGENRGGRTHNELHRHHRASGGGVRSEGARDAENDERVSRMSESEKDQYGNEKRGGRIHRAHGGHWKEDQDSIDGAKEQAEIRTRRAHGGRAGKGKTVVNVVIAGRGPQAAPMPAPMGAAPPPMPMPPPRPPTAMPMPPAGAPPMGAPGVPPSGGMPMRARGGKVDGYYAFGKGGTPGQIDCKETYGSGGGKGRIEKARREEKLAGMRAD